MQAYAEKSQDRCGTIYPQDLRLVAQSFADEQLLMNILQAMRSGGRIVVDSKQRGRVVYLCEKK